MITEIKCNNFMCNCATCTYWGGERRVENPGPNAISVTDLNIWGKCFSPTWRGGRETRWGNTCPDFEKWGPMKN